MLPADILGVSIFDRETGAFQFHPGPIFAHVILADEVNRATPKTQSALLEAMEEHQVTAEGETRPLPEPFFVIATQNPSHQIGTFPLPESQLDRFLMRIELGYPDAGAERALLQGVDRRELLPQLAPCMAAGDLLALQNDTRKVHAAPALLDYPRPEATRLPLPLAQTHGGQGIAHGSGQDDFSGLRSSHPGDSPRHIAWKAVAREQGMLTKQFSGRTDTELWLEWQATPESLGIEGRVSRLARWVIDAHAAGLSFGLRLPGVTLPPAPGNAQHDRCLEALAMFDGGAQRGHDNR